MPVSLASTSWLVLVDLIANFGRFLFLIPDLSTKTNSHTAHPTFYSKSVYYLYVHIEVDCRAVTKG